MAGRGVISPPAGAERLGCSAPRVWPFRAASASRVAYPATGPRTIPKPVRWAYLLFIFTIPFEAQDLGILSGLLSPARIVGMFFFAVYLFFYNPLSRRGLPAMPPAVRCFLAYVVIYALRGLFIPGELAGGFVVRLITLTQILAFVWVSSDLMKNAEFAKRVLGAFTGALLILALDAVFGVLGLSKEVAPGRTTVLREDLNGLATNMGIAVLILIGFSFYFYGGLRRLPRRLLIAACIPLPLLAMVETGSRGGVAAFVAGLLVFLAPYWARRPRLGSAFAAVILGAGVVYLIGETPEFRERWEETYYERDLSTREKIFPVALGMILERPVFGWHREQVSLDFRLGLWSEGGDPHNLFLHLLLEVGVVGTIPFLIGLWLCGKSAWKARAGLFGLLPVALLITVLVASLSLTTVTWKTFWLMVAFALASGGTVRDRALALGSPALSRVS